jgi:FkbM family methyltransferase
MKFKGGVAFPDADSFMLEQMHADGRYQADHLETALAFVTDWSCAIDGGAHVGLWSRRLSPSFTRVIAVEPSPDTCEALMVNMAAFGCANVEVLEAALGETFGSTALALDAKEIARQNTGARYVHGAGPIPVVPIDSWKLETCGFLKLDVEGSEAAALRGAQQTLTRCRPVVLFENKDFGSRYGVPRTAPGAFLTALGYTHVATISADEIWMVPS